MIPSELLGGLRCSFIVNDFSGVNKSRFWNVLFNDGLYNTLQNLRHIKILLPKTEQKSYMKNSLESLLYSKLYQFVLQ